LPLKDYVKLIFPFGVKISISWPMAYCLENVDCYFFEISLLYRKVRCVYLGLKLQKTLFFGHLFFGQISSIMKKGMLGTHFSVKILFHAQWPTVWKTLIVNFLKYLYYTVQSAVYIWA
jgi:hypothetical protein